MDFDIFISHASEDKEDLVRPLAEQLRQRGLRVWLDETELKLGVSPAGIPIYAGRYLFRRSAFLKGFSFGVLALRWASPAYAAPVSSLFDLQRMHSQRYQLSFLQRCAASVAQRFFVGRALLQVRALPFGHRV